MNKFNFPQKRTTPYPNISARVSEEQLIAVKYIAKEKNITVSKAIKVLLDFAIDEYYKEESRL